MSIIEDETTDTDRFRKITDKLEALRAERSEIGRALRSAGVEADKEIKAGLSDAAQQAEQALADLDREIKKAENRKAGLDAAVDRGDDSVHDMELFSAGTAIRRLRGKRISAAEESRKAQRTVQPFLADDHLALLAAGTLEDLVDCPVIVRKRERDVDMDDISAAVVLSQVEPTEGYGTFDPSGRVKFTELGETGLDLDTLRTALQDTGAQVQVHPGLIDYQVALWPLPRLVQPSEDEVTGFARLLADVFQATIEGPTRGRAYTTYSSIWETTEASLEVTEPGRATGRIVAHLGIEREQPPLDQMQHFITQALSNFQPGTHTSAGMLDEITVVDVEDAGPWVPDGQPYIHARQYAQRFILTVELDYSYLPVEV